MENPPDRGSALYKKCWHVFEKFHTKELRIKNLNRDFNNTKKNRNKHGNSNLIFVWGLKRVK
jgi:hypothetical protein